jgi:hypothetical protein
LPETLAKLTFGGALRNCLYICATGSAGFGAAFAALPHLIAMLKRRPSVGMNPCHHAFFVDPVI